MKLLSGTANKPLATKIASVLGIKVSPVEFFIFPDKERRIQIQESVLDEDIVIVQPTATPAEINYFELFFLADAAKRSGAKSITAVVPYLGYQRQDHIFREGEAVSLGVILHTFKAVGLDQIIAVDLHTIKAPEISPVPMKHLSALSLFAQEIQKKGWGGLDTVLVSPDMGGIRRITMISKMLSDMPYATIEKNRDLATGHIHMAHVSGEVTHRAIIVDDMISSGNTMVKAAELLRQKGAKEVHIFATHPVFSQDAPKKLQESIIDSVYTTDSVFIPDDKHFPKLHVLSLAESIAHEIAVI